jgi:hypothetical protein
VPEVLSTRANHISLAVYAERLTHLPELAADIYFESMVKKKSDGRAMKPALSTAYPLSFVVDKEELRLIPRGSIQSHEGVGWAADLFGAALIPMRHIQSDQQQAGKRPDFSEHALLLTDRCRDRLNGDHAFGYETHMQVCSLGIR